jgi:UPF0755 protein
MSSYFKKILLYFFIVVIVFILGFVALFDHLIKTPAGSDSTEKVFEIKDQTSTLDVASALKSKNLISEDWAFVLYVKLTKKSLKAGSYLLSSDMSIVNISTKISSGDTAIRKITIPEGFRTEQIAQYLANKNYVKYSDFVSAASGYDGKLFPDTYYISVKSSATDIVKIMNDDYIERTKNLTLSKDDLIIASIVEREAKSDTDRPIIAGIFKNRLAAGMKLESNPTVLYAYDSMQLKKTNVDINSYLFWRSPNSVSFDSIISPYNTYLNAGLPPTSICNPGLKSIEATINYTHSNYYYFLTDSNDVLHAASTFAEHQANVNKYLK